MPRRPDLRECLLRRILHVDHFDKAKRLVHARAFKSKTPLSMTDTKDKIVGQEDLEDYVTVCSMGSDRKLGVAVMDKEKYLQNGLRLTDDPIEGEYGELHVLGPDPVELTKEVRDDLAALANDSGWSLGPEEK